MCKQDKCSQSEIDDWIVKYGVHESGAMGAYSKVVKLTSTPNSAQQQSIVHAVAKALGQDSTQTMAQIRTLAREGGFCKAVCTAAEISHWANERGKDLPPPLSTFAVAIAGTGLGATAAADAVAEALGQDPSKLRAEASDAAFKAGFCKEATCTTSELSTWAASEGTKLTGGLGAYVSTLYSSDATTSENPEEILHKSGMCKKKDKIFFLQVPFCAQAKQHWTLGSANPENARKPNSRAGLVRRVQTFSDRFNHTQMQCLRDTVMDPSAQPKRSRPGHESEGTIFQELLVIMRRRWS